MAGGYMTQEDVDRLNAQRAHEGATSPATLPPAEDLNMVAVPANTCTPEDMNQWFLMQAELKRLKAAEMLLRKKIFGHHFPNPVEGTNTFDLADGWKLKGTHKIDRNVDQGAFTALRDEFGKAGLKPDELVEWKPSLKIGEYRKLTEEQMHLFDQCLIIKPGSPELKIVLPAKAAGK